MPSLYVLGAGRVQVPVPVASVASVKSGEGTQKQETRELLQHMEGGVQKICLAFQLI
jgi:hypothetical protein